MISHGFDALFSVLAGFLPVPFLRAVSYHESGLNPNSVTKSSNATGLFQVVATVLKDYNLQHGTKYTLADTKDPQLNSQIGIGLLTRIVRNYEKHHPNSLRMDWSDPRYVELVVQGFNAGYSEAGGVGLVVGKMEKAGIPPEKITVDTVAQAAKSLKASRFLSMPERVSYAKAVAKTYFNELARDKAKSKPPMVARLEPDKSLNQPLQGSSNVVQLLPKNSDEISVSTTIGNEILLFLLPLTGLLVMVAIRKPKRVQARFY